jgi:hypothetical protein
LFLRSFFESKELLGYYDGLTLPGQADYLKRCEVEQGREVTDFGRHAKKRKIEAVPISSNSNDQAKDRIIRVSLFGSTLFVSLFRRSSTFRNNERRFSFNRGCSMEETWMDCSTKSSTCSKRAINLLLCVVTVK